MNGEITIRPPQKREYEQAVDCIVKARGGAYYSERYYAPSYLFGREHEIYAAFDANGAMMGITGISRAPFDGERSMLSLLNVKPEFAGKGAAKALLSYTVDLLVSRRVRCIKGQVVTRHAQVQGILERLGLLPAGVLYGVRDGLNASPVIEGKCPLIQIARNVSMKEVPPLFVHEDIAGFARKVYAGLNLYPKLVICGAPSQTRLEHSYDEHDSVLWVLVNECGTELTDELERLFSQYDSERRTMTVLLNLNSPTAIYGCETLRSAGYRFCGFDPLGDTERAIFFKGFPQSADMRMSERMAEFYDEVRQYE